VSWDLLALGEPLLRLQPDPEERLEEATRLHAYVGGAELNVACALASLGRRCAFFSALPEGPLGRRVLRHLRAAGVDTSAVRTREGRLGLYWVEYGREPRSIEVHYDRRHSAVCALGPADAPAEMLRASRMFFVSGITAALSPTLRALALEMAKEARRQGVTVAVDLNFRARLWTAPEAAPVLEDLARGADVLVSPEADLRTVFGWTGTPEELARIAQERLQAVTVVLTCGGDGAVCLREGALRRLPVVASTHIDRVGAGDAFTAGLLYGLLEGRPQRALDYAVAMASLKHSLRGDAIITTPEELERVASGQARDIRR
jgi:2-dehydro-3-deoxygluconokinase